MCAPEPSVQEQIDCWIRGPWTNSHAERLIGALYQNVLGIARSHLNSRQETGGTTKLEAEDLAMEFLLSIRKEGKWMIRTRSGLAKEYRRWVTSFSNPAQHELWKIVSTALHHLAKAGVAWRIDAPGDAPNDNSALWTGIDGPAGETPCDLDDFKNKASKIRHYAPPSASGYIEETTINHLVISPKDAKQLTSDLLNAAGGAICLRDLLGEFKEHVFSFEISGEVDEARETAPPSIHPASMERIYHLVNNRVDSIWLEVQDMKGTDLLCQYIIPKHVAEAHVTLGDFGSPQRVQERVVLIMGILKDHLALDSAEAFDVEVNAFDDTFKKRFQIQAIQILGEKCGCRPGESAK